MLIVMDDNGQESGGAMERSLTRLARVSASLSVCVSELGSVRTSSLASVRICLDYKCEPLTRVSPPTRLSQLIAPINRDLGRWRASRLAQFATSS